MNNKHLTTLSGMGKNSNYFQEGLSFEVIERIPQYEFNGEIVKSPNKKVLLNGNTGKELYFGGQNSYRTFTNREFEDLAGKIGNFYDLKVHHFGEHGGGKKVLVAFENNEKFEICGHGVTNYIVMYNGHDGTCGLAIGGSSIMHRCGNIIPSVKVGWKFRHNSKLDEYVKEFEENLVLYHIDLSKEFEQLCTFSDVQISSDIIERAKLEILGLDSEVLKEFDKFRPLTVAECKDAGLKRPTRKMNLWDNLTQSIDSEVNQLGSNVFGLHNGFTHYLTHNRNSDHTCLNVFGTEAKMNKQGFQICNRIMEGTF